MKSRRLLLAVSIVLCLVGVWLSSTLADMHARGSAGTGLLAGACGGEGSGCDAVIHSRWGVFPPGPADDAAASSETPRHEGTPVALLGLFYFVALTVWFAAIGHPDRTRRWMYRVLIAVCGLGTLASMWFVVVMAFIIDSWCPLCLSSHIVNFLLFGVVMYGRPRDGVDAATRPDGVAESLPYPSNRLLGVTAALAVACCVAFAARTEILSFEAREHEFAEVEAELDAFKQDAETLRAMYESQAEVDLQIKDEDPTILNEKTPYMRITYFSDLECPQCAKFDRKLFEEIKPLFNGHLRIVFKHFPLPSKHPNALAASVAAQAAHLQGKFWEAHSYLIERHKQLGSVDYNEMARELGLDVARFAEDMKSPAVVAAVRADQQSAARLRLTGAPAVFLNNRPVNRVLRGYMGFWEERAETLRNFTIKNGKEW